MARTTILTGLIMGLVAASASAKYVDVRDPAARTRVVASYRELGPQGLDVALGFYDYMQTQAAQLEMRIARLEATERSDKIVFIGKGEKPISPQDRLAGLRRQLSQANEHLAAWRTAIDEIGSQRGCLVSRLFWYTDLDKARAAAESTGRPILSLRMLGKLTDEFSCANSRFFRTALYSNGDISRYLRDHFVLHWQSVRPVPRVTIDFGDGRKLERTLTGNSAHYVLTSAGEPLDVLPGLYAPQAFENWLARMQQFHFEYVATAVPDRAEKLASFHRDRRSRVYRQWADDIQRIGESERALVLSRIDQAIERAKKAGPDNPVAAAAARLAVSKRQAEAPLLRFANFSGPWIDTATDDALWQAIANLHREEVRLDDASVEVMRAEFPRAAVADERAYSKQRQEDPILRVVREFEDSMTLDTVRNEYVLHRQIHDRFVDATSETANVDVLNEWVYATLFLTPSSDPWLGLAPRDVYTALENDGRVEPAATVASRDGR